MINQTYSDIVTEELAFGAIYNNGHPGFKEDYLCLFCLIRKYRPKTFFEVGTNCGVGTKIIKHAMKDGLVYSLDLPTELAHLSPQHPIIEGKGDCVGYKCNLPFIQLRGDSMTFDYSQHPCEGAFIDGEHSFENVYHETTEILKQHPKLIVHHDSDGEPVMRAIIQAFIDFDSKENYELYRVVDTRIAYILKKEQ